MKTIAVAIYAGSGVDLQLLGASRDQALAAQVASQLLEELPIPDNGDELAAARQSVLRKIATGGR